MRWRKGERVRGLRESVNKGGKKREKGRGEERESERESERK